MRRHYDKLIPPLESAPGILRSPYQNQNPQLFGWYLKEFFYCWAFKKIPHVQSINVLECKSCESNMKKLCAIRNVHLWQRYNNARLHQDEPLKSGCSGEGKNLGVWITRGAAVPELTRVTLPEQAPGCPDTSAVALPCKNQCVCSSSENSNMQPTGQRYTVDSSHSISPNADIFSSFIVLI